MSSVMIAIELASPISLFERPPRSPSSSRREQEKAAVGKLSSSAARGICQVARKGTVALSNCFVDEIGNLDDFLEI
jgi:hypothetical protein